MSLPPTMWCNGTLVIFDGPRRLAWSTTSPGQWSPVALWPTPRQAERVVDHLHQGGSVLILVEQEQIDIPMYVEEASRLPDRVTAELTTDDVIAELHVRALDWLPESLRERGLRFLRETDRCIENQPDLLLPHLLLEEPDHEPGNLRFGRVRAPRPFTDARLTAAVDHLFAPAGDRFPAPEARPVTMETAS